MAKGTGTYDDPIICDGIFSKTIDGVKKFFKLNTDHATTSIGQIAWFAQPEVPNGYLVCNGANVSRTTYADLFNAIGTTFGSGDGSTTFTLPNLIDKFAQGSTTVGTVKNAGLPNITGGFYDLITSLSGGSPSKMGSADGVFYTRYLENNAIISIPASPGIEEIGRQDGIGFNASRSSSIYGNSETVQPPALTLLPCIRY